ncbi:MAG: YdbL family protein [Lentisphaerota bacterium]
MKSIFTKVAISLALIFSIFALGYSDDIKDRMSQRLPAIIVLKDKGIIGENSSGYLAYVASSSEGQSIVNAENADRKAAYEMIAQKTGSTADAVGRLRAAQIAQNEASGHYIQKNGYWVKK